jgi:hypothetical protein
MPGKSQQSAESQDPAICACGCPAAAGQEKESPDGVEFPQVLLI